MSHVRVMLVAGVADQSRGPRTPSIWEIARKVLGAEMFIQVEPVVVGKAAIELAIINTPQSIKLAERMLQAYTVLLNA